MKLTLQIVCCFLMLSVGGLLNSVNADRHANQLSSVLITGVPHVKQKPDFCGEACAEMYLHKLGETMDQDFVFDMTGVDPALGRGAYTKELADALAYIGFEVGKVWNTTKYSGWIEDEFALLHADLKKGIGSIVCMHASDTPDTTEHFRLILGYDRRTDKVIYHEPAMTKGAYQRMSRRQFFKLWPLGPENNQSLIRIRLEQKWLIYGEPSKERTNADYAQHVMSLKKKLLPGFTIVVESPFVIIGDESPQVVLDRAKWTVRYAANALRRDFFEKDPDEIIDVWLFKDDASYRYHTKKVFNDVPTTPYGYYDKRFNALIMNIGTGGGTLVHEMVHPYMDTNFKNCPPWFNEGLGSLYEATTGKNDHLWGLPNWRLPDLKRRIRTGRTPGIEQLTALNNQQFYGGDSGLNYAMSRYLLYYLQEKGLLFKYYKAFYANRKNDPSGYKTLKRILNIDDVKLFQTQFESWVLQIHY